MVGAKVHNVHSMPFSSSIPLVLGLGDRWLLEEFGRVDVLEMMIR